MNGKTMRDSFWDRIYELAQKDKDIVIVSADLGAPSLDKFRRDFPKQFINTGISEQNAILMASGLALTGKKPLAYAITQFLTLRSYEQFRIYPCGMNLPVTLVGVGAGVCYSESGPTHHSIEDIAVMRTLPNLQIYNSTDSLMAKKLADIAVSGGSPKFIRLDRDILDDISMDRDFAIGFEILKPVCDVTVVTTGNMTHTALRLADELHNSGNSVGVIDVFRLPVDEKKFVSSIALSKQIITIEEHSLVGGLGSYVLEILNDSETGIPVKRIGFDTGNGYKACYNYGGREAIRQEFGMGYEELRKIISAYL